MYSCEEARFAVHIASHNVAHAHAGKTLRNSYLYGCHGATNKESDKYDRY